MNLELLRTFLELNRRRHFGRTANALHLTQAAVSSRLKSLESQLGVQLFERNKRSMKLTRQGRKLVPHAEAQITAWQVACQEVSVAGARSQLLLGGSLRIWNFMLQPWLHKLRTQHSDIAITAESQTPEVLTRLLVDGALDLAIMLEPAQLDFMHIREVAKLKLLLVSREPGLSTGQAMTSSYVYVDWGFSFGLDHRRAFPDAPEAMTRVSQANMAFELIKSIGGSAYLPDRMVRNDIDAQNLHLVEDAPHFTRCAFATYPVRSGKINLIETLLMDI